MSVPEEQGSLEHVTRMKCIAAANQIQGPVMIEDSAVTFNAMNGMPGPYIKAFMTAIGDEGLIQMLKGYTNGADMTASCISTLGYSRGPGHEPIIFQGDLPVISTFMLLYIIQPLFLGQDCGCAERRKNWMRAYI